MLFRCHKNTSHHCSLSGNEKTKVGRELQNNGNIFLKDETARKNFTRSSRLHFLSFSQNALWYMSTRDICILPVRSRKVIKVVVSFFRKEYYFSRKSLLLIIFMLPEGLYSLYKAFCMSLWCIGQDSVSQIHNASFSPFHLRQNGKSL